jgi:hypothetical protein
MEKSGIGPSRRNFAAGKAILEMLAGKVEEFFGMVHGKRLALQSCETAQPPQHGFGTT